MTAGAEARGHLRGQVLPWLSEGAAASAFLGELYVRLEDPRQRAAALQALDAAGSLAGHLGLTPHPAPFSTEGLTVVEAEAGAWSQLIQAQAGLCAFRALVPGPGPRPVLRPWRAMETAFKASVLGVRTAFPDAMAEDLLARAFQAVARTCADLFVADLGEEAGPLARQRFHAAIRTELLQGFQAAAESVRP
ncbi:hypothetical protein [Geothrix sp. 21YS21S-2]|uniref:hypothetical protein n=1 Tax=Geothrix sp. 21YS21S-2 TaxID=3068893 RepID=UPI0027B8A812|nr:hypothetical protein [Geothrix sp. 21YS21S-2]